MYQRSIVFSLFVLALSAVDAWASPLRVGAAKVRITPDPLLPVSGGMGVPNPTTQKLGELTARAMVIESGSSRMVFVSVDLLGFPSVLISRVAALVPGLEIEQLMVSATHTHSAPDVYAFPDGQGGHTGDLKYIDFVVQQTAMAIKLALAELKPAKLRIATDEAQGKIAYNYYAPDLYDRRMSVIQACDTQGTVIVTLVNYAIHPEVLGADQGIVSPDLIGPLCEQIEGQVGGLAMFVNGAQGGMITADNRKLDEPSDPQRGYWHDARTWEECQRIGNTMAAEALRIISTATFKAEPRFRSLSREVTFPVDSDALWQVVVHSPLNYPHGEHTVTSRIHMIQLDSARILTIPGEALPNIGFYLKRKLGGEQNLLFGLTNDAFGYILTKEDFNSFARYNYVSRVSLGEMTGEILIRNALELAALADANN